MATKNITLSLTEKEFEIVRRAIIKYTAEQMHKSETYGKVVEDDFEDGYEIRANIAGGIQDKIFKKIEARPELENIFIF